MRIIINDSWQKTGKVEKSLQLVKQLINKCYPDSKILEIRLLYWKKAAVFIKTVDGNYVVKMGFHPYSRFLLLNELVAINFIKKIKGFPYGLPDYRLIFDDGEVLLIAGAFRELKSVSFFQLPSVMWYNCFGRLYMKDETAVKILPSHGDFVHWNVFIDKHSRMFFLLDFEYFSLHRPILFDEWHWICFPLIRKWISFTNLIRIKNIKQLWQMIFFIGKKVFFTDKGILEVIAPYSLDELLILYLSLYNSLLCKEIERPDIIELIGQQAFEDRWRIINWYKALEEYGYENTKVENLSGLS